MSLRIASLRSMLRPTLRRLAAVLVMAPLAAFALATPAQAQHATRNSNGSSNGGTPSTPQVARTAGQFTTLLAAVDAAGLTETLLGRGPFTLFAPTDEAFRRLPSGTVTDLLKPENRDRLRTLLTYHVLPGRVTAAEARRTSSAETVAGARVTLRDDGGDLRVNDAIVRIADVPASNGLVHVIDRVLMPTTVPCDNRDAGSARRGW